MSHPQLSTRSLDELIRTFEDGTLDPETFSHADHLRVALFYVATLPFEPARDRFRSTLLNFVKIHNISVYSETVTQFWMKKVFAFWRQNHETMTAQMLETELVRQLANSRVIQQHFSPELLATERAKTEWVEPDREPLA